MATKAKTTKAKTTKAKTKVVKKINNELVSASIAAINTTISNGEKWQELASKLVKESETVRKQQLNMFFDTAEALKKQANSGAKRMQKLVGLADKDIENAKNFAINNPVSRKVVGIAEDVSEMVSENPMVKKAEKTAAQVKAMGMAKFNDVKEDVLDKASKILDKGDALIQDAKTAPKTKAKAKKVVSKAKTAPKKVVKKVAPKKAVAKVAAKAKTTKNVVARKAKAPAKKVTAVKAKSATNVAKVEVIEAIKTLVKDDLKLIYGVGPKTETLLNNNGIVTYADLAKTDLVKLETILAAAGPIYAGLDAKDWLKQAEVAVKDGASGLAKWVEKNRTA